MPHTKTLSQKKKTKPSIKNQADEIEEVVIPPIEKIKRIPDLEIGEEIVGSTEEKPEVDPLQSDEETEESGEDALDEEEINPFGDKWEV